MAITPPWALHVGANRFNRPTAIGTATTVTADDTSVTFTALDGQLVSFSEYSTNAILTGTDINNSGCAAGDRGELSLSTRPAIRPNRICSEECGHTDRRQ
jgi:hypothetical protein